MIWLQISIDLHTSETGIANGESEIKEAFQGANKTCTRILETEWLRAMALDSEVTGTNPVRGEDSEWVLKWVNLTKKGHGIKILCSKPEKIILNTMKKHMVFFVEFEKNPIGRLITNGPTRVRLANLFHFSQSNQIMTHHYCSR